MKLFVLSVCAAIALAGVIWAESTDRTDVAVAKGARWLASVQGADGGWGWLSADESDAFGTGVALYSLARGGLASDHPAIARARQYLIQTQTAGGSWPVKGTKKNKAQQIEPTATYWGTCWAAIGLAETLAIKARA